MYEASKVSVIIPTREEEGSIGAVVRQCLSVCRDVLVVDGHSSDGTRQRAAEAGARVVLDRGLGKGDAFRVGLSQVEAEVVAVVDGDGSHDPTDIPLMADLILQDQADLVIGSRLLGGSEELHGSFPNYLRMVGAGLITLIVNQRFGQSLTDTLNGFRAIRRSSATSLGLRSNGFAIEQEMIIRALKKRLRIREVPSHERARCAGRSKLPTIQGLVLMARLMVEIW